MWKCKYCLNDFDFTRTTDKGNHAKHCENNPKRVESYKKLRDASDNRFGKKKQFEVICKSCNKPFNVIEREKLHPAKDQYFCSRICSNSVGGKAKAKKYHYDEVATYNTVAWRHHERECIVCGEDKIVAVHHVNENHNDNRPENLVPLCPTHHHYMHSRYKNLIESTVNDYIKNRWG